MQPLWSVANGAWVVADGNTQNFYINANWTGNIFNGTYGMTVFGDQLGTNYNDFFAINTTSSGGMTITMNNETESWDDGRLTSMSVSTGGGINNVAVYILIGGNSADVFTAGTGRSILVGDGGADHDLGNSGDDIVIGGSTKFDSNYIALQSLLAEWQSANSFTTRISHLKNGGGLNGVNKLVFGNTVIDDGASNVLTGGGGTNWFFKGDHDKITDQHSADKVN